MLKRSSVKWKITIWYLLLMVLMAGLILGFILLVSSRVISQSSQSLLLSTVRANLSQISVENGRIQTGEDFHYYTNGVYTLIYNQNEALLAGQIPVSFSVDEPFENGKTRLVRSGDDQYYVLDLWLAQGWEEGLWVRGLMEAPAEHAAAVNVLWVAAATMPVFILLAAVGGYWIAKRAFRPLDEIIATAGAINQAADLSARVTVPAGNNEFSRLAATFNQMFERLEQLFESEKQFTADASHELRTPVSVIKGACEYAQKYDETPEERAETLEMIHRQTLKMSNLIDQLLHMTRLEQGTETAHLERTDLSALVHKICQEQAYPAGWLIVQVPDGIEAMLDGALLPRLLQNLLDNAYKYGGGADGHAWVSLTENDQEILLSVRDNGIGIPADQQEKIWRRFYQVDAARSGGNGVGLGLSMVRKIAEAHHGYMTLESVPDMGSKFTLHLPHPAPQGPSEKN